MITVEEDPALARKRRIEQRRAEKRQTFAVTDEPDSAASSEDAKRLRLSDDHDQEPRLVPSIRGIKRTTRYEPGVPMTKDELKKWRKEARRVRNRESAAASRQKTRERIDELEGEVSTLQAQLKAAQARIAELEATSTNSAASISEVTIKSEEKNEDYSRVSPVPSPQSSPKSSPLYAPRAVLPQAFMLDEACLNADDSVVPPVLPTMISRPTAA